MKRIPKSLSEVWEWKERAWESTAHLPTLKEKLDFIRNNTGSVIDEIRDAQQKNKIVFGESPTT